LEVLPGDIVNGFDVTHQRSDANFHYGTMSLPLNDLDAAAEAIIGREFPKTLHKRIIRPGSALMLRLLTLHKSVGQLAHDSPDVLELPEVLRAFENELIHVMVRCLAEGAAVEPTVGSCRHDTIVARFEEFLEANPDRPLYLTEICAAIGVAERTLRASCEEHLGMGPIRYLTLRRMHLVRRALLRSDPSEITVTQIVTDHGFWELGRFSVAYGALFGESPSCTLRRPVEQPEVCLNRPSSLAATALSGTCLRESTTPSKGAQAEKCTAAFGSASRFDPVACRSVRSLAVISSGDPTLDFPVRSNVGWGQKRHFHPLPMTSGLPR
jgi:AraC-like DNA-binding protein